MNNQQKVTIDEMQKTLFDIVNEAHVAKQSVPYAVDGSVMTSSIQDRIHQYMMDFLPKYRINAVPDEQDQSLILVEVLLTMPEKVLVESL